MTPQERLDFRLTRPRTKKENELAQAAAIAAVQHTRGQRDLALYLGDVGAVRRWQGEYNEALDTLTDLHNYVATTPEPGLPSEAEFDEKATVDATLDELVELGILVKTDNNAGAT
jgi:hypothetical protein